MIAITTRSSIRVKPGRRDGIDDVFMSHSSSGLMSTQGCFGPVQGPATRLPRSRRSANQSRSRRFECRQVRAIAMLRIDTSVLIEFRASERADKITPLLMALLCAIEPGQATF